VTLSLASLLSPLVAVLLALVVWLTVRLRARTRELRQALEHMTRYAWVEWWTRNAAETTPLEPARPYMVALAYAASIAPNLQQFSDDCEALANDHTHAPLLRNTARQYAVEWHAPVLPWVDWARATGKPMHNEHAQRTAYAQALQHAVELSCILNRPAESPPDEHVES
jgi:hypothetical protein